MPSKIHQKSGEATTRELSQQRRDETRRNVDLTRLSCFVVNWRKVALHCLCYDEAEYPAHYFPQSLASGYHEFNQSLTSHSTSYINRINILTKPGLDCAASLQCRPSLCRLISKLSRLVAATDSLLLTRLDPLWSRWILVISQPYGPLQRKCPS